MHMTTAPIMGLHSKKSDGAQLGNYIVHTRPSSVQLQVAWRNTLEMNFVHKCGVQPCADRVHQLCTTWKPLCTICKHLCTLEHFLLTP